MINCYKRIFVGVKEMILSPKKFWSNVDINKSSDENLFTCFFLPLLIPVFLAVFAGELIRVSGLNYTVPLMKAARVFSLYFLFYFISLFLTNELISAFGGVKNIKITRKLVTFSLTPFLLVSIITGLFPFFYILEIAGFYGFYIFWTGVVALLKFPEPKTSGYILVSLMSNFFVFSFLSIFLSKLLNAFL